MKIKCSTCGHEFEATREQQENIEWARGRGMTFLAMQCPELHTMFYNPQTYSAPEPVAEVLIACPCKTCSGFVTYVEPKGHAPFWGCGECGQQWQSRQELDEAITQIVQKYPYRQRCYRKAGKGWEPIDLSPDWLEEYQEQVQKEWEDEEQG
jgi:transcription elongation factor Elf1